MPRTPASVGIRALVITVLLLGLAVIDKPERTMLWDAIFDAGHVPLFGAISLLVCGALTGRSRGESPASTSLKGFILTVAIGGLSEIGQVLLPYRDVAWSDFARNVAGAAGFLLIREGLRRGDSHRGPRSRWPTRLAAAGGAAAIALALIDLGDTLLTIRQRARAMPAIVRFDGSRWESRLVHAEPNRLTPAGDVRATGIPAGFARLDLQPATYSGLRIDQPYPDWRGYSWLVLSVASDLTESLTVAIRIDDARHDNRYRDRFNAALQIAPGAHHIRVPLDQVRTSPDRREMDMGRIRRLVLFVHQLRQPTRLYLGPMWLE
jgi:hypothetical protein